MRMVTAAAESMIVDWSHPWMLWERFPRVCRERALIFLQNVSQTGTHSSYRYRILNRFVASTWHLAVCMRAMVAMYDWSRVTVRSSKWIFIIYNWKLDQQRWFDRVKAFLCHRWRLVCCSWFWYCARLWSRWFRVPQFVVPISSRVAPTKIRMIQRYH